jgi:polysaccharide biosynthesis/export protein
MRAALKIFSLSLLLAAFGCADVRHGPAFNPRSQAGLPAFRTGGTTNVIDPAWLRAPTNEFRLGPGDKVDIEVIGDERSQATTLVGPDGKIYFDLLPGLEVWGFTTAQVRDLLQHELSRYVRNPRVSVSLREVRSSRVWVLGRLETPGIYPLAQPTTVVDAITRAGGLYTAQFTGTTEELADLRHSFLLRHGRFMPVDFNRLIHEGDMSQNIYLEPDDFIYLPSALSTEVYVLGAVTEARAVSFKDQVTLSSAIANARGTLPDAWLHEVVIIRGSLTNPHYAVVNFLDILKGRAPEVPLQPRDIVYVPDKPLAVWRDGLQTMVNTFVRTVAANEGLRAGGDKVRIGVGVSVGQ